MTELLQPTNTNRENLDSFIAAIEDEDLQQLIRTHLATILEIGKSSGQTNRQAFFEALKAIINNRISEAQL